MRVLTVLIIGVAFTAAGCGGGRSSQPEGGGTARSTSQAPFDRAFIDAMVPHHQSAIAMAKEAKLAGITQPDLIKIANDIVANQQSEIDQMLAWRKQWFGTGKRDSEEAALKALGLTPAEAGMEHGSMRLSDAVDVDETFAQMMTAHHRGAIRMARLAEGKGGHTEIKTVAGAIITAQKREIAVMEKYATGMKM